MLAVDHLGGHRRVTLSDRDRGYPDGHWYYTDVYDDALEDLRRMRARSPSPHHHDDGRITYGHDGRERRNGDHGTRGHRWSDDDREDRFWDEFYDVTARRTAQSPSPSRNNRRAHRSDRMVSRSPSPSVSDSFSDLFPSNPSWMNTHDDTKPQNIVTL